MNCFRQFLKLTGVMMILVALSTAFAEMREMYTYRAPRVRRTADRTAVSGRQMYSPADSTSAAHRRERYFAPQSSMPKPNATDATTTTYSVWNYDTSERDFAKRWTNPWKELDVLRNPGLDADKTRTSQTSLLGLLAIPDNSPTVPLRP